LGVVERSAPYLHTNVMGRLGTPKILLPEEDALEYRDPALLVKKQGTSERPDLDALAPSSRLTFTFGVGNH
jgi:hypothetical protein